MLNAHFYDRRLIQPQMETDFIVSYKDSDFIEAIDKIIHLNGGNKILISMLNLLKHDRKNNKDNVNNINFEPLFVYIYNKIESDDDLLPLFLEQIADIKKGTCQIGRTTRIMQIYNIFQS